MNKDQFSEALLPVSYPARPIQGWGDYRIEIAGYQVSFSCEDPGIQVCFEGKKLPSEEEAAKIVAVIAEQISRVTGQGSRVVKI
ncbi:MAG: hypothetical protein P4L99_05345 [Chthoniobacter sp.]|nr:hypothetical protein [Chthoniobacter sp.]